MALKAPKAPEGVPVFSKSGYRWCESCSSAQLCLPLGRHPARLNGSSTIIWSSAQGAEADKQTPSCTATYDVKGVSREHSHSVAALGTICLMVRPAQREKKKTTRHDGSLCTQKQPETAALQAAIRKSDPRGGEGGSAIPRTLAAVR